MNLDLAGQTAVIAGGAKGIGRAIGLAFAAEGANVVLLDLDPSVATIAKELEEHSPIRTLSVLADVTDFEAMRRSADEVHAVLGRTDHVVYCVAVGLSKYGFPFWNLEPAEWRKVLEVNVVGAVNVVHAFTPALARIAHRFEGHGHNLLLNEFLCQKAAVRVANSVPRKQLHAIKKVTSIRPEPVRNPG